MQKIYHNVWLLRDRVFFIALFISIFWHLGLFSFIKIHKIIYSPPERPGVALSFLQNKWTEKSIELPGRSYQVNPDGIFTVQQFTVNEPLGTIKNRLAQLQKVHHRFSSDLSLLTIDEKSTILQNKDNKKPFYIYNITDSKQYNHYKISPHEINNLKMEPAEQNKKATILTQHIEGPVQKRNILHHKYPEFPEWAKSMGLDIEISLQFWVQDEGYVNAVIVEKSSSYPEIDSLFVKNLKQWRFLPMTLDQTKQHQWGIISFNIHLAPDKEVKEQGETTIVNE